MTQVLDHNQADEACLTTQTDFSCNHRSRVEELFRALQSLPASESERILQNAERSTQETRLSWNQLMNMLRLVMEATDPLLAAHSQRVGALCFQIGEALGLSEHARHLVSWAGSVHEFGTALGGVLDFAGNENSEFHPLIAKTVLSPVEALHEILFVFHSPEADADADEDLTLEDCPAERLQLAQVIKIADAFDTLTTATPLTKSVLTRDEAIAYLRRDCLAHGDDLRPLLALSSVVSNDELDAGEQPDEWPAKT